MKTRREVDRAKAEEMLVALLAYVRHVMGGSSEEVRKLVHPQAEMRLLVSFRKPLRGRAAIVNALERGQAAIVFRAGDLRFRWLDDATVLSFGHARYATEGGQIAEGDICWLSVFRDGLIWRVQAFDTEEAARSTYEETLSEPDTHTGSGDA